MADISGRRGTKRQALRGDGLILHLTDDQVAELVAQVSAGASAAALVQGFNADDEMARSLAQKQEPSLSKSLLRALAILAVLADGEHHGVNELAQRCRISPSTTHRYVRTLHYVGLVVQDPMSRKYRRARP